jgi:predicted pyridoxine 5'-phosphate oxidase superfamily flavin-nucleotide-binding protein
MIDPQNSVFESSAGVQSAPMTGQEVLRRRYGTEASGAAFDRKKKPTLSPEAQAFIARMPVVFISTARMPAGETDGNARWGEPGFIHIADERTLLLPDFPGNGALQNWGNLYTNPWLHLFFIHFQEKRRLCVRGRATLLPADAWCRLRWPKAERVVRLDVTEVFFHCSKHFPDVALIARPSACSSQEALNLFYRAATASGLTSTDLELIATSWQQLAPHRAPLASHFAALVAQYALTTTNRATGDSDGADLEAAGLRWLERCANPPLLAPPDPATPLESLWNGYEAELNDAVRPLLDCLHATRPLSPAPAALSTLTFCAQAAIAQVLARQPGAAAALLAWQRRLFCEHDRLWREYQNTWLAPAPSAQG